ncbi:unnamed protein product [Diatraea saccharalis]|uniref:Protein FAM114A2 n=1 Tax=Diatraea saccharalis TaxID=40085 RepID=A0A9N9N2P5_9NEOP|nr:unnamed protein product [Diatraea saccharalis]
MPSSDSEDFESADEGQEENDKKVRKKRTSSSNYGDNALETISEPKETIKSSARHQTDSKPKSDGWDDFDIDCPIENEKVVENKEMKKCNVSKSKEDIKSQDTGWDDFDDWGNEETLIKTTEQKQQEVKSDKDIKELTDKLAASTVQSSSWGWGWGVDSLLSSATAGITSITSQVSQGISNVLETGIGAPDPEELARKNLKATAEVTEKHPDRNVNDDKEVVKEAAQTSSDDVSFPFGSLLSGVTKFVETTGTKVIAGGLDTLETIGKKTMEVLQDGDPGLAKKRAMLGLDPGEKPVLSQILREAKAKADEEDKIREEKREAKEVHYENLFDDFEGLVHLEALEMLSKQVSMRIEERLRAADPEKKQDIKETMQQVIELCEIPEDEDDEETSEDQSKPDAFHEKLQIATQDLGLKLQFQSLVKQYTDILDFLSSNDSMNEKVIYKRAVSSLAQATALSVEIYHKTAEMLLVKTRRSTADEADALTQMTVVLTKHISELATLFTVKLNSIASGNKDQINNYITNIFLESGNSSTYIQNAFQLTLPILQIGAV